MSDSGLILFIGYSVLCLFTGFISNGQGSSSEKLSGIFGSISILAGIACIIMFIVWHYWTGIIIVIAIYLIMLNIGGALMRRCLRHLRM